MMYANEVAGTGEKCRGEEVLSGQTLNACSQGLVTGITEVIEVTGSDTPPVVNKTVAPIYQLTQAAPSNALST